MNLKEIQAMWKVDCPIDDIELDASSLEVPKLHAKYAELLSNTKLSVIRYERQMKEMDKDKWLWYSVVLQSSNQIMTNLKELTKTYKTCMRNFSILK